MPKTLRFIVLFAVSILLAGGPARAQEAYPSKPVRMIVPFAPGGPADIIARLVAQKLTEEFGKQFYVENHAGAGGNIGAGVAARAAPDGYSLMLTSQVTVINPHLYKSVPYDPDKDFIAGHAHRDLAERAGGASVGAGQDRQGTGRADQARARQIHRLCPARPRHLGASERASCSG